MGFDFIRTLNQNEVRSTYINLTDDRGRSYGSLFPKSVKQVIVVDAEGRTCKATRKPNQLWGNIARWFRDNAVTPGTRVRIQWQEGDYIDDLPAVHVFVLERGGSSPRPAAEVDAAADAGAQAAQEHQLTLSLGEEPGPLDDVVEPDLRREDLKTLDEWEAWLRWQIRQVELLGEIDVAEHEWRTLARLIREAVKGLSKNRMAWTLREKYPATFATYLVAQGIYGYMGGDYWTGVVNQTGLGRNRISRWGELFETILERFRLPRFPDMEGHRFVSVILAHGGIPNYSLPDFFENVLIPARTRPQYADLPADELIDALLERTDVQHFTDVPVRRFLEFGGQVSEEFLQRCLEMVDAYLETGEVPPAEEIGLPSRVVNRFAEWVAEQEELEKGQARERRLRLRKPQVIVDPWGDGVSLRIPSQEIPATLAHERLTWKVLDSDGAILAEMPARVRRLGYDLRTDEYLEPVPEPWERVLVEFYVQDELYRSWPIRLFAPFGPVMAFHPDRNTLLAVRHSLPAEAVWLLFPAGASVEAVEGEARLIEAFPPLPGHWSRFELQAWDLSRCRRLRITSGADIDVTVVVRPSETPARPHLEGGERLELNLDPQTVPVYLGGAPRLRVPLSGRRSLEEELRRWRVHVKSLWAAEPTIDRTWELGDLVEAMEIAPGSVDVALSSELLLGARPRGTFRVDVRGPLGRRAELRFRIWPELLIENLPPFILPRDRVSPEITFRVRVPPGDEVGVQAGGQGVHVTPADAPDGAFDVTVAPETNVAELVLVHPRPGGEPVEVPIFLPIPRPRWRLVGLPSAAESTRGEVLKHSVDEVLERLPDVWVRLHFPYLGAEDLSVSLVLRDSEDNVLHQGTACRIRSGWHVYRLPLAEFTDTIRLADTSLIRVDLSVSGPRQVDSEFRVHLATFTRDLAISDVELTPPTDEQDAWVLQWREARAIKNRVVRLSPAWRPWEGLVEYRLPDDARGRWEIRGQADSLAPGRYLVQFDVEDPWITSGARPFRLTIADPGVTVVDAGTPEGRLDQLNERLKSDPYDFSARFERACLLTDIGEKEGAEQDLDWCIRHPDKATAAQMVALRDWLTRTGFVERARQVQSVMMFTAAQLRRLRAQVERGEVSREQVIRYLASLPSPESLDPEAARVLLTFDDERAWSAAVQALLRRQEEEGVRRVLHRVRARQLSERDAVRLLSRAAPVAARVLRETPDDEMAVRLLEGLASFSGGNVDVVRPGIWVRCVAGWGKIESILDPDSGEELSRFVRGHMQPVLKVRLRVGEKEEEQVRLDLRTQMVEFLDADKVWLCTKCNNFATHSHNLLVSRHDHSAHEGRGASLRPTSPRLEAGDVVFSLVRPRDLWA